MFLYIFPYSSVYDTQDINGSNFSIYPSQGSISLGGGSQITTSGAANNVITKGRFAPTSGTATFAEIRSESLINQTGGANGITRGLYVNPTLTAAADWRSIEWSNNSGWGLYGAGTAYNYLASRLGIGTTSPSSALHVVGTINATNVQTPLVFSSGGDSLTLATQGGTSAITIFPTTRNVLIQNAGVTADAGYRLDVNGTARVSGQVTGDSFVPTSSTIPTNGMYLPSANTLGFASGTSARMVITSTGVVGIGPTSPTGLFEVKGDGASSFTRGTKSILLNPNVVGADTESFITTSTGMAFAFGTAATERMRITSGGNLLVGTTTDVASSKVTIASTTQGFLPPRMTTTQKNAIGTPAAGLVVYDTDTNKLCCYNGTTWNDLF